MESPIALFCILHPSTPEKRRRVLSLLASARSYYTSPESKCTTWAYFLPSTRADSPQDLIKSYHPSTGSVHEPVNTIIAGLEIYTAKSALSVQLESSMFKNFHSTVRAEELYAKDEELVAWYPATQGRDGFVRRSRNVREHDDAKTETGPGGVVVVSTSIICRPDNVHKDRILGAFQSYAEVVCAGEPNTLSGIALTRPKASDEILMIERFAGQDAREKHTSGLLHVDFMKVVDDCARSIQVQEWIELDNAFVGETWSDVEQTYTPKL